MDDLEWESRKEFNMRKGKDGWPEVIKEERIKE